MFGIVSEYERKKRSGPSNVSHNKQMRLTWSRCNKRPNATNLLIWPRVNNLFFRLWFAVSRIFVRNTGKAVRNLYDSLYYA